MIGALGRIAVLMSLAVALLLSEAGAQPRIGRDAIPASLSPDIRRQVDELYAPESARRANAACELGRRRTLPDAVISSLVSKPESARRVTVSARNAPNPRDSRGMHNAQCTMRDVR